MKLPLVVGALGVLTAAFACAPPASNGEASALGDPEGSTVDAGGTISEPPPAPARPNGDAGAEAGAALCVTVAPNHRCGLDPQCGCGTNETCDVTNPATGATSCVTAGMGTLGRPCNQSGDCLAGLTCAYGACRPYCTTPQTKCGAPGTELCVDVLSDDDEAQPNMRVCTIACDPREPKGVCGTNACHWVATAYAPFKVSDCNFGGSQAMLDPCNDDGDCQPGLACAEHPSEQVGRECEQWCRLGQAPSDCPAGFTCTDVFGANAPVFGGMKEGLCQDPVN